MDWRLELVQVPVSDVDRAKELYERAVKAPDRNGAVQQIPPRPEQG